MGGCASNESEKTSVDKHDSVTRSVPTKIGTIGNSFDYEDTFSRSRANAPSTPSSNDSNFLVSNLNQYANSFFIRKNQRTFPKSMTPMTISEIPMSPINKSPATSSRFFSDSSLESLHDEIKVNKYYKNSVDYASGQFAQIFITNLDENNTKQTQIAIKKINMGDWTCKSTKKSAENELKILKLCNTHQNIVKLVDSFYEIDNDNIYMHLAMEFIPSTLKNEINKYASNGQCIPFKLIQIYSYQILRGINYINYIKHVIHRNINPENILINPRTNCVKICDFSCAKQVKNVGFSMLNFNVCSRCYRAPELLLESTHYSYEIDIWSFGCILSELFLGNILFDGMTTMDQMKQIIKTFGFPSKTDCIAMNKYCKYDQLLEKFGGVKCGNHYNYDADWKFVFDGIKDIPQSVPDLIGKILKYNPMERLHPFEAMKHPYFKGLQDTQCDNQYVMPAMFDLNDEEINFHSKMF